MQCQACNTANADTSRFCENCGTGLAQICSACGYECGPTARFCGGCGGALGRTVPPSASTPVLSWGELKQATILFADIVASTEHVSKLDPEQAMEHFQPAVAQMCEAIASFGGTVVRTLGDGIMAVFGVPRALEGHASLACEAALAMQEAFKGHVQGLRIRVGLHSGQVASEPQAADATIGGGLHGHAIHLASRVVALAEPGGVCLTSACLALVRPACEVRPMGAHKLKGIAEPTEIHALLRIKNDVESLSFHQAVLSSFRGRKRELAMLQDALRRTAESGLGAVIGLSGAPGTGKSRLSHEFVQWCRGEGATVYEVRTQLYGHATPLQPVLALLRKCFFQISATDDPVVARERIAQRLSAIGPASPDDLALLNEFLGVPEPGAQPCSLQAKARRVRLLGLVRELAMHSGANTLLIVFEDLHWLDEASEEFLYALVEAVAKARTLLLLNYRPSYRAPWATLPHFQQMNLAQLSTEDTEDLVRELLSSREELKGAFSLIVERSGGNPFFAEELIHSLAESGVLSGRPGGGKHSIESIAQALPPTVQAVIGERIDRLLATQKTLLHICAVIGKEIPLPVLQQVTLYLANQLESGLDGLCEAELLQLLREISEGRRFAFRHPLIQEVAYNTQLKTRRADLHAAVAVAMEVHYRTQPDEFAALIAYHYEAAGQYVNAAQHEARAAQWLGATNSTQAMRHWRKARALLLDQPRSPDIDRLRVRIGGGFVYLGWREGLSPDELQLIVRETTELATEVDGRLIQLLFLAEGRLLQGYGGPADDYVQSVQKALALSVQEGDVGRTATMNAALSHAYAWAGLLEQALAANDVALRDVAKIDKLDRDFFGFDIKQWVLGVRGRLLVRMGRLEEARLCLQALFDLIQPTHDPVIRQMAHHCHAELAWLLKDTAMAHEHASVVAQIARENGSSYSRVFDLWNKGLAQFAAEDFEQAALEFAEALKLVKSTQVAVEFEAEILASLAECHYQAGNLEQSLADATAAVAVSRQRSNRVAECRALIVWGGALARGCTGASPDDARAVLEQARKLIVLTGAKTCEAALLREQEYLMQEHQS
jgi:class 3 adenylate cyclase/tetratricopeptide (TPR) repeat protein